MNKKKKASLYGDFKNLIKLTSKNGYKFVLLGLLDAVLNGIRLPMLAMFSKHLVDYAMNGVRQDLSTALNYVTAAMSLFVISCITSYFINKRKYVIGMDIKRRMFSHFQKLPVAYFDNNHSGDTIARINGDTDLFLKSLDMILTLTKNFVVTAIMLPAILVLDIRLGILGIIVGTLASVINKKFRVPIRKQNEKLRKQMGSVLTEIIENISGFKIIKTYNLQQHFESKFNVKQDEVIRIRKKSILYNSFLYSSNTLIYRINSAAVLIYGTYLIITGVMTVGVLVALRQLTSQIGRLLISTTESISKVQDAFSGSDRVIEFLNQSVESGFIDIDGDDSTAIMSLSDVKFSYSEVDTVLNGISISVNKGEKIALVGYSGHGKSTLVKILLGLYDISEGKYTIEGKSACELTKEQIRSKVSYVSQNATIFNGTIKENILHGNLGADMVEVEKAAIKAHAHEFILGQVDKYDTVVGERGVKLSGGQRQRIALARAILKDGEVLILDEATSSLDSKSEEYIKDSLNKFMKNRTSIVIAHRLSTVENSDRIYMIEEGKVIEEGTHRELLALNGKYSQLYFKNFV